MSKPDPTGTPQARQTDDHVQNSALGAVNPKFLHPGSGKPVPVSPATPDDEPRVSEYPPPYVTGHDIHAGCENSSTTPAVPLTPVNPDGTGFIPTTEISKEADFNVPKTEENVFPRVTPDLPPKTPKSV